jgi:hypothetical protein
MAPTLLNSVLLLSVAACFVRALAINGEAGQACGLKITACPSGQNCKFRHGCDNPNSCLGRCVATIPPTPTRTIDPAPTDISLIPWPYPIYQSCGGKRISPKPCPRGFECIDDPRIPGCGMACDRPGICVHIKRDVCGGIAGFPCPPRQRCYDVPGGGCDPGNRGADCSGICLYPPLRLTSNGEAGSE